MYICIFKHFIYGSTGTELPPPLIQTRRYVVHSKPGESQADFRARMRDLGMAGRQRLSDKPTKPYSCKDGLDWQLFVDDRMEEFDLTVLDRPD